jgi:hypothetical protein
MDTNLEWPVKRSEDSKVSAPQLMFFRAYSCWPVSLTPDPSVDVLGAELEGSGGETIIDSR